jgi:cobalt-precorrin-5B (C1)-methyltransferase
MHFGSICQLSVIIEVPEGKKLARQSLTDRIGVEGGVAIQETPALNRMVTPEAWHRWITQALTIAREMGINEVILTPGARSERFARGIFPDVPPESFVLTADHIEHALTQAKTLGFSKVFYVSHFAKMLKSMTGKMKMNPKAFITSLVPVYHIALVEKASEELLTALNACQTPREGLELLIREEAGSIFFRICQRSHRNLSRLVGNEFPLEVILLSYDGEILSRFKTEKRRGVFNILNQPFSPTLEPVQPESE